MDDIHIVFMEKENDELKKYVKKLGDKRETVSSLDEVKKKYALNLQNFKIRS